MCESLDKKKEQIGSRVLFYGSFINKQVYFGKLSLGIWRKEVTYGWASIQILNVLHFHLKPFLIMTKICFFKERYCISILRYALSLHTKYVHIGNDPLR